ncbi:MAG TPA: outer membrane protein transport protein [Polyangiaceae bacterium]|jgi:long-chain fatty acid transport protein
MSTHRRLRFVLGATALSVGAAALLAPRTARASGFLTDQFGSDHGHPALANAYSVYFNPAAMAGTYGTELTLDGVVAARSLEYDRPASALSPSDPNNSAQTSNPTYQQANTGQATLFNVLAAPYIGFTTDFGGSKFRLGVASYIPFGGQVSWQKNNSYAGQTNAPGGFDGPQRWSSISTTTSSIYETAALAYRIEALRLGVGASVSVIRTGVTDVRARNADGSDDIFTTSGALKEGRAQIDVSGIELGAAAGVYWDATPDGALRLGASYTSQPSFGTMRLKGTFKLQPGSLGDESTTKAELLQAYPDVIRAGAAWRIARDAELRLDATWQRWSVFKNQCLVEPGASCDVDSTGAPTGTGVKVNIPRDWNDSVKMRLGGAYWINPETELFGSFAYETAPVGKSHEDALTFDSTRLYGTLGVRHAFSRHVIASLAYTYVYFVPVTVNNSAYPNSNSTTSTWPSGNGHYSSELFLFDAALSYRF